MAWPISNRLGRSIEPRRMMNSKVVGIEQLLGELKSLGVQLAVKNGRLMLSDPQKRLTSTLKDAVRANKEEIIEYVVNRIGLANSNQEGIEPVKPRDHYPTTSQQRRLFALQQMDPVGIAYNIPGIYRARKGFDIASVQAAVNALLNRHESLRTRFMFSGDELVQQIEENVSFEVEIEDIEESEIDAKTEKFVRAFDLSVAPLFRLKALRMPNGSCILLTDMHHIISDGISNSLLIEDFAKLFEGQSLEPLLLQYKDYSVWQQEGAGREKIRKQKEYWLKRFETIPEPLSLPTDFARLRERSFEGRRHEFYIDENSASSIRSYCRERGVTLYMFALSCFHVLLSRYTGQSDVVSGCPVAGREFHSLDRVIGMFVNTLALRTRPDGEKRFEDYLSEVKAICIESFQNQQYPFEELIDALPLEKDMSRNPLFDAVLVVQNFEAPMVTEAFRSIEPSEFERTTAKFDLGVEIEPVDGKLVVRIEYASRLFRPETIELLGSHFEMAMKEVLSKAKSRICELRLMGDDERTFLIDTANDTNVCYPNCDTVLELFENQACERSEKIALLYGDEEMTYADLDTCSNALADRLKKEYSVSNEQIVGLAMDRSFEMIVGILAVLKVGGAYLPIDPQHPADRISYMLDDSGCELILVKDALVVPEAYSGRTLSIDSEDFRDVGVPKVLNSKLCSSNLAYVIYTSGSTGQPKGVAIEHRGLTNLVWAQTEFFGIECGSRVLQAASFSFDASVSEIFTAICAGATLVMPKGDLLDNINYIAEKDVTVATFTPSMLAIFDPRHLSTLETVVSAGERCPFELARSWSKHVKFINAYGPTENTVCSTFGEFMNDSKIVSIGRPIPNHKAYILGPEQELLPIGAMGELYVSGCGLARGYLHREELTKKSFIDNPFKPGTKMYRTGDLVRWRNGEIEFIERRDNQIKIRGIRTELGEIEASLRAIDGVKDAAVILKRTDGKDSLVAFVAGVRKLTSDYLASELEKKLPRSIVPSTIEILNQLPVTSNGKVDKHRLKQHELDGDSSRTTSSPRTRVEKLLVNEWQSVLGVKKIGIDDDFFKVGGDSILAAKFSHRLHQKFDTEFLIKDLFTHPTIRSLASELRLNERSDTDEASPSLRKESINLPFQAKDLDYVVFCNGDERLHHFTGSMMFDIDKNKIDFNLLNKSISVLIENHQELNLRLYRKGGVLKQELSSKTVLNPIVRKDLGYVEEKDIEQRLYDECKHMPESFSFDRNHLLIKFVWFDIGNSDGAKLFTIWHHWLLDTYGVGVLFAEIEKIYRSVAKNEEIRIEKPRNSLLEWNNRLIDEGKNNWREEAEYWMSKPWEEFVAFPKDSSQCDLSKVYDRGNFSAFERRVLNAIWNEKNADCEDDEAFFSMQNSLLLTRDETLDVMRVAKHLEVEIIDILLFSLHKAANLWSVCKARPYFINNSSRGMVFDDLDMSQTPCELAVPCPVFVEDKEDVVETIKSIRRMRLSMPNKGVTYLGLKYHCPDPRIRAVFKKYFDCQEIVLNYNPPVSGSSSGNSKKGMSISKRQLSLVNNHPLLQKLNRVYILAHYVDGKLRIVPSMPGYDCPTPIFNNGYYHPARIIKLGKDLIESLKGIVSYVSAKNR